MWNLGCTVDGDLDDTKFSEPMPWIGIYVVVASAVCAIAMALDAIHGFHYKKFWFPCKFFALNATTLTLITVATKLSVDLNTSMPRQHDQLAKLSSTALICTAIGNFLPSLGAMENKELMMNVVAMGILVVTVIVNICIQLGTGVIYVFFIEHVVMVLLMMILLALMISSSLAIPAAKYYLDLKYNKKYKIAKRDCDNYVNCLITEKLRTDLERYWIMAHTCNPQFVVGRLATCTASGAFCLLSALTLAEAMLRCYMMPWSFRFCNGVSDYKWSTGSILLIQAIAVGGGSIAPTLRWFLTLKLKCPERTKKPWKVLCLSVEGHWIKELCRLKEIPLDLRICGRFGRKLVHHMKNKVFDACIGIQKAIVVLSKSVGLASVFLISWLLIISHLYKKLIGLVRFNGSTRNFEAELESKYSCKLDLRRYVLHLEGEEELIDLMMESDMDSSSHWIKMGRKKQPLYLIQLLEKLSASRGFKGVHEFDNHQVPSLESEEPPNSWALPVVTLTSIAVAIAHTDFDPVQELIKCVHEGLKFIRVVENNLDVKRDLVNIRKAAEISWAGVDLHHKWLDVELREMAVRGQSPREVISELSGIAKSKFMQFKKNEVMACLRDSPSKWPVKVLAANSMYRICQTFLMTADHKLMECNRAMLEIITAMITDIMGACLANLQHAISIKCHQSSIEQRAESVRSGILLLGKSEKILEILNRHPLPCSDPAQLACVNEWRALRKEKDLIPRDSSPSNDSNFSTPDIYLNVD